MAQYDSYGNLIPDTPKITAQVPKTAAPKLDFGAPAGYTPDDWAKLILGNSGYMGFQLSASERQDIANANRQAALRTLAIRYGGLPSGFTDQYGDIDQGTLNIAQNNPLSEYAKAARKYSEETFGRRQSLGARGMTVSGELPYELGQADYQHASDLYDLGQQFGDAYQQAIKGYADTEAGLRSEQMDAIRQAASDAYGMGYRIDPKTGGITAAPGSDAATRGLAPLGSSAGTSAGIGPGGLRANAIWDVNSASPYAAATAARAAGSGLIITEGDPYAAQKAEAAAANGTPFSMQVNLDANDTPESLAAKVAAIKAQFPNVSGITLDLESPNARGYQGSPGWDWNQQAAALVTQAAGGVPLSVSTEGVKDFNFGAWSQASPTTTFAPQAYAGDMTPGDVWNTVMNLVNAGIPLERIIPIVGPNQSLQDFPLPVSVYGVPTQAPQQQLTQPQLTSTYTALNNAGTQGVTPTPDIIKAAAQAATASPTYATSPPILRSRPGME